MILLRAHVGQLEWVSSEVVEHEISLTPDGDRRSRVAALARMAARKVELDDVNVGRGAELEPLGFGAFDALHIACAERAADVLLTTDDKLVKLAMRHADQVRVTVRNPLHWLLEGTRP